MSEYTPTTSERGKLIHLLFDQVPEDWDENDIGIMADALEESAWLSFVIATAKAEQREEDAKVALAYALPYDSLVGQRIAAAIRAAGGER